MPRSRSTHARTQGYTLVEMLIVVVLMSIAAAVVIPTLSSAGVLRIQGALRMVISDITNAQADAIAFQQRRAVVFNYRRNGSNDPGRYIVCEVNETGLDQYGISVDRNIDVENFGNAQFLTNTVDITSGGSTYTLELPSLYVDGNTQHMIVFDELGTPMANPTSTTPAGSVEFTLGTNTSWQAQRLDQFYRIRVEAITGRVTLQDWTP